MKKREHFINEEIRSSEVRITGDIGQGKIYKLEDALNLSMEHDKDLILINDKVNPYICILEEYSKFMYNNKKKEKENKNKQVIVETKEVKFGPNIHENDLLTKLKQTEKFLNEGDKVKVTIHYKGREMQYHHKGYDLLNAFANELSEIAKIEVAPKLDGKKLFMILTQLNIKK